MHANARCRYDGAFTGSDFKNRIADNREIKAEVGVIVFEKNAYCYKGMEGIKMNEIMNTARQAPVRTNVNIENRERISVTGITRVDSFDEGEVSAATDNSGISVYGQNLHISRLDLENGILTVDGFITGVEYSDKEKREGLFSRIFK